MVHPLQDATTLWKPMASILVLFILTAMVYGQGQKPLTSEDLIQMTKAFNEQTVINAIAANGVSLDTSVQGLQSLKSAGVSENVINAALKAVAATGGKTGAPGENKLIPDEIGAYVTVNNVLTPLPVEVVNYKMSGMFVPFKKVKLQGTVPGSKSATQITRPIVLVLRCADGTAPTEYQLVALDVKKEGREFTEAKAGLTGANGGVNEAAVPMKFEKIARNTYRATLSDLKRGEYGILAPGALSPRRTALPLASYIRLASLSREPNWDRPSAGSDRAITPQNFKASVCALF